MRAPALSGRIERRICIQYRINPSVARRFLPDHIRPKLYQGSALGGICVFRFAPARARILPIPLGFGTELAWHRIAVEWDAGATVAHGQYLLRCEADSRPSARLTPKVLPCSEPAARITVRSNDGGLSISMKSVDGNGDLNLAAVPDDHWPEDSVFPSAKAAQLALSGGHVLWPSNERGETEGFEVAAGQGTVASLTSHGIDSAWYDDRDRFPLGSIGFDSALLISRANHEPQTAAIKTGVQSLSPNTGKFLPA